jgi:hypothetical protein
VGDGGRAVPAIAVPRLLGLQRVHVRLPVVRVTARLRYRKYDQFLLNYMFGVDSGITAPITDIATAEATVRVVERSASAR